MQVNDKKVDDKVGFISPEDVIESIKIWSRLKLNSLKAVIFTAGFISGWLFASGDLLFGTIIIAVSLYFSITKSGGSIINYLVDNFSKLFEKDSSDKVNS